MMMTKKKMKEKKKKEGFEGDVNVQGVRQVLKLFHPNYRAIKSRIWRNL